jgi:transposase-like protein
VDGLNLRRIARQLGVVHQTVANWVAAYADSLPEAPPLPPTGPKEPLAVCELDELYTFEGDKKTGCMSSPR